MVDPYKILGVGVDADDEAIRKAYLRLVREFPPERDSERFQVIRRAYETLENQRKRLEYQLFATPEVDMTPLLTACLRQRNPQRPASGEWLDVLRHALKEHRFIGGDR
ncbi:MAG: J domain-containing protein [Magnetococcus sp. DMHC-1]